MTKVSNLQVLCSICNRWKGSRVLDFRKNPVTISPAPIVGAVIPKQSRRRTKATAETGMVCASFAPPSRKGTVTRVAKWNRVTS